VKRFSNNGYILLVLLGLAVLAAFIVGAGGAILASKFRTGKAMPSPTATLGFPIIHTATPTAKPTQTLTPYPTGTPTHTPTPTATMTPTPTPTPTPRVITLEIRSLGQLETAKFLMQTVIDRERAPSTLWDKVLGTDKLLLVVEGQVVAGFDMTQIDQEDIIVAGDQVTITLPPAKILYSKVNNDKTYVYERKTGLLRKPDKDIESEARTLGEQAMLDHALQGEILKQAEASGRLQVEAFLHLLGFTQITVNIRDQAQ
jgi:hypothetical protein